MADDTANPRSIRAILSRIKAHFKRVRPGKKEREDDERFFARIHEDLNCSKVAISSLTEDEIEKVFKLKKDGNPIFDIPVAELFPVPDRLGKFWFF